SFGLLVVSDQPSGKTAKPAKEDRLRSPRYARDDYKYETKLVYISEVRENGDLGLGPAGNVNDDQ
ncbi:MAG: hypothetical protein ACETWG_07795, partial [Candidatus Neomarinimicrobiota bacterium]